MSLFICEKHNSAIVIHDNIICPVCIEIELLETKIEDEHDEKESLKQDIQDFEEEVNMLEDRLIDLKVIERDAKNLKQKQHRIANQTVAHREQCKCDLPESYHCCPHYKDGDCVA